MNMFMQAVEGAAEMAQDAAEMAQGMDVSAVKTMSSWEIFNAGGWLLWPLLALGAVAVFIASLAGQGVVPVAGGLAVMLGADVGSALVAALLTFNIKGVWPILVLIGYAVHSVCEAGTSRHKQHGRFLLDILIEPVREGVRKHLFYKDIPYARIELSTLGNDAVLTLLLLAGLTWLSHSSISVLLLLSSLVEAGVIRTPAFLVTAVLGVNLGAGLPAVVLTSGQDPAARRICVGNCLFRCAGVALGLLFLGRFTEMYAMLPGTEGLRVVLLHIVFNALLAVGLVWIIPYSTGILERLIPDRPAEGEKEFGPRYISPVPGEFQSALPISTLSREALHMADVVQSMLTQTKDVLCSGDCGGDRIRQLRQADDRVDVLYRAIRGYAIELSKSPLSEPDLRRVNTLLRYSLNLENIGDIIDKSLLDIATQKTKAQHSFSTDGNAEMGRLFSYAAQSLQLSADVIMAWRKESAASLVERKREFKTMAGESAESHLERLRQGVASSLTTSSYHLDIINDLQRIHSLIADLGAAVLTEKEKKHAAQQIGKA